jgi:hypothetical protein
MPASVYGRTSISFPSHHLPHITMIYEKCLQPNISPACATFIICMTCPCAPSDPDPNGRHHVSSYGSCSAAYLKDGTPLRQLYCAWWILMCLECWVMPGRRLWSWFIRKPDLRQDQLIKGAKTKYHVRVDWEPSRPR